MVFPCVWNHTIVAEKMVKNPFHKYSTKILDRKEGFDQAKKSL